MSPISKHLFSIHIAVFLFGFAGLFAKFLEVGSVVLVFGRTSFASLMLAAFIFWGRQSFAWKQWQDCLQFIGLGGLLAIHWGSFFYSIQISSVAIGLLTVSTFPIFVSFLEPLLFRQKPKRQDIVVSLVVVAGLVLVIPSFDFQDQVTQGAFWGTISGFTFALLSVLNRRHVQVYSPVVVSFYQNLFATLFLVAFLPSDFLNMSQFDWFGLLILGVLCTAVAHTLFIQGMASVRAQTASLITGLEPVYGIVLAFFLLDEHPSGRTLAGGGIILLVTAWSTYHTKRSFSQTSTQHLAHEKAVQTTD